MYAVCLALGAGVLLRSLALQLFWPLHSLDSAWPAKHRAFCKSQLVVLHKELEEATWQDAARGLKTPKGFCAKEARMARWQQRLATISERCQNVPPTAQLAERLGQLAQHSCVLFEQAQLLWRHEGRTLSDALQSLPD